MARKIHPWTRQFYAREFSKDFPEEENNRSAKMGIGKRIITALRGSAKNSGVTIEEFSEAAKGSGLEEKTQGWFRRRFSTKSPNKSSWRERWAERKANRRAFWLKRLEERAKLAGQRKWIFLAIAVIVAVVGIVALGYYYGAEIKIILRAWGLTL